MGCLRGNEMGLSGLFGKWIKIKRNGLSGEEGTIANLEERGRRHYSKSHLAGALTGRLGGQTTSVSAQIWRGCSTRLGE